MEQADGLVLPVVDSATEGERMRQRYIEETEAALDHIDYSTFPYERTEFENFSKVVLRRVDDRYLKAHSGRNLVDQLTDSLCFLTQRQPGEIAVRVFEPTDDVNGYSVDGTIIETLMDDQPFIVDTLKLYVSDAGLRLRNSMNVILGVDRDESGTIARIHPTLQEGQKESYCRLYAEPVGGAAAKEGIASALRHRLGMARRATQDYHRMKKHAVDLSNDYKYLPSLSRLREQAPFLVEASCFLDWMVEDHFIFMGMSFFEVDAGGRLVCRAERGLGIKAGDADPCGAGMVEVQRFFSPERGIDKYFVQVRKSQEESLIHRAGKVDEILVRRFDLDGNVVGGIVAHGLFTYKAISSAGGSIPILRRKLAELPQLDDVPRDSYLYKATEDAFNSLPVEYLFNATGGEISRLITMMLRADNEQRMSVHLSVSTVNRSAYLFVVVPKKDYSDELRESIEDLVKVELRATYADHRAFIGKHGTVVLHFFLSGGEDFRGAEEDALGSQIILLCSSWREQLRFELQQQHGEERANELFTRYADQFDDAYRATRDAKAAADDIANFEKLNEVKRQVITLNGPMTRRRRGEHASDGGKPIVDLVLYQADNLYLTEVLPKLHHFGLRVIDQYAHSVALADGREYVVDTFRVDARDDERVLMEGASRIIEAMDAVFERKMPSSPLNRLVITAGLTWQQVDILRAYGGYGRQLASNYAIDVITRVLNDNPEAVRALIAYFEAKFDPDLPGGTDVSEERRSFTDSAKERFTDALSRISSFVEDRILYGFFNLVDATVRTNAYQTGKPFHYLSFKFDCSRVEAMSDPRPWREIYVHHIDVEGVHLRGGPTARGGLRWSDRLDDYRSEILGLMTTQMVKNTVIVPVGAKGGFVVRHAPSGDAELRRFADSMYKVLIRGLLDVTDNRIGGAIVHPPRVVRYDGDDSYLVVAADKGTAHLSDTANSLSAEYGFWLGDAFASGGSNGYDHKVEGITAKGAWACVREHFREMGVDPEKDVIRVVGIGDMSGDVFGNGLLLSRTMKLVGAFNHRHIFIDPDPDPERSFQERKRLFDQPRSSWRDYDASVMSKGGAIYERSAKSMVLSPEARAMLKLDHDTVSPAELISKLLALDVDLLWNGGIGTYVKASTEDHRAAADKTNDDVRIDAVNLRAKVVGEGGNLGMTQAARIEYALAGGRANTDFVDNAGGVNLSDHEVNLKVLFAPLLESGAMTAEQRNALLREVAPEVVEDVVQDNELLSLRLSLDELRSRRDIYAFGRTTKALKQLGVLDPARQKLPTLKKLVERVAEGRGLTRPELATLGAHAKMQVYRELVTAEPLPPRMAERFLRSYFPKSVYERFGDAIASHLLLHEIVSTMATNVIVEYAGTTFFGDLATDTERPIAEIALAYITASDLLDTWALKSETWESNLGLSAEAEQRTILAIEDALRDVVVLFLHTLAPCAIRTWTAEDVQKRRAFVMRASESLESWLGDAETSGLGERRRFLTSVGVPDGIADRVARLPYCVAALAAWFIADSAHASIDDTLQAYVGLAGPFGIARLHQRLVSFSSANEWEVMATRAIRRMFFDHHAAITRAALSHGGVHGGGKRGKKGQWSAVGWLDAHPDLRALAEEVRRASEHEPSISALVVLGDRLTKALRMLDQRAL